MKVNIKGSSSILSVEYLDKPVSDMIIEFVGGGKYLFRRVNEEVRNNFLESDSKGKYFAANIRNKFQSELYVAGIVCDMSEATLWSWPFPTKMPPEPPSISPDDAVDYDKILEWTPEEEEAFLDILKTNDPKGTIE